MTADDHGTGRAAIDKLGGVRSADIQAAIDKLGGVRSADIQAAIDKLGGVRSADIQAAIDKLAGVRSADFQAGLHRLAAVRIVNFGTGLSDAMEPEALGPSEASTLELDGLSTGSQDVDAILFFITSLLVFLTVQEQLLAPIFRAI